MAKSIIEAIAAQTDNIALWKLIHEYFELRNIDKMSYHHILPDVQVRDAITIQATGFPSEWLCHYTEAKLFLIDPITELAARTTTPFLWSEIEHLTRITPEQQAYLTDMRTSGVRDGLAFQVFGPGLRNGYVGLGLARPEDLPSDADILSYQMILQAAHLQYCALNPPAQSSLHLSPRECEVLRWIARGKSNMDIADILHLSRHTVDTLVRRIFSKLDVTDRTTAAVQGLGAGLIQP